MYRKQVFCSFSPTRVSGSQARNQEFFRGVFLELKHFNKHSHTIQERKAPPGKNLRFFRLESLKNSILNENFTHRWPQSRYFFLQIGALFSNFWKRAGETSSPSHPLVTRLGLIILCFLIYCSFHNSPKLELISSDKWSDLVQSLKAQGKFFLSFPCTLFFTYFWNLKITNWAFKKISGSLHLILLKTS